MALAKPSSIRWLCALLWLGGCQSSNGSQAEPIGAVPPDAIGMGGAAAIEPVPPAGPPAAAGAPAPSVPDPAQGAAGMTGATGGTGGAPVVPEPETPRPDGWQEDSHARGATPDYDRLFADDRVHRIDLEMTAASHQAMQDDLEMLLGASGTGVPGGMPGRDPTDLIGGDPIYVPITMRYEGRVWTHVGMRLKGNSSLASAYRTGVRKLGFRLDFDRYEDEQPETTDQRFYGFAKMTFSSGFRDPSLLRDKLASEILADQGLIAARAAFYRVFVDAGAGPEYWGLYTMIEDPSDQMVETQFADDSGNLYKPDGPGADFTTFDMEGFDKKSNEDAADYSDVIAAIDALHAPRTDAAAWRAGLEAVLDVQSFLDVLAFSRAIGHWDSYGGMRHNYYLYGDPLDGGKLVWISWDHNLTWGAFGSRGPVSVMMDEVGENWPLIRFLLDDPVYRAQYVDALRATLGGAYDKAAFDARAAQLHALIEPHVVGTEGEQAPYTFITEPNQFHDALADPTRGLITAADTLRAAVSGAVAQ